MTTSNQSVKLLALFVKDLWHEPKLAFSHKIETVYDFFSEAYLKMTVSAFKYIDLILTNT